MENRPPLFWGLNGYQWTVLFAAWLGWGFDAFDALLFNFVAPNCIPTLTGHTIGTPEARQATLYWTGVLSALLLLGWAAGGILFGRVADRIGRSRTLILTILLYSLGTAACAFVPSLGWLAFFRTVSSLGIGGEWAAGAAMVAEVVPENKRVQAGALLYTAAPLGIFLAGYVDHLVSSVWFEDDPTRSWRYVFLAGLIPAAVAIGVRWFVREPERWQQADRTARLSELFSPAMRQRTFSGLSMAVTALLAWWSCNAFLPLVALALSHEWAAGQGLTGEAAQDAAATWRTWTVNTFNSGGLLGTILTVPIAYSLGRRATFGIYFLLAGGSILATFGLPMSAEIRLGMFFLIGLATYGVLGSFTYYLPELFPTRLRATGAGFCYNVGRILTAAGPFLVGAIAARAKGAPQATMDAMFWVGVIPLAALVFLPWVVETRGRPLE